MHLIVFLGLLATPEANADASGTAHANVDALGTALMCPSRGSLSTRVGHYQHGWGTMLILRPRDPAPNK
jgi:hypothetical protein